MAHHGLILSQTEPKPKPKPKPDSYLARVTVACSTGARLFKEDRAAQEGEFQGLPDQAADLQPFYTPQPHQADRP